MKDLVSGVSKVATVATVKNDLNYTRWQQHLFLSTPSFPASCGVFFAPLVTDPR